LAEYTRIMEVRYQDLVRAIVWYASKRDEKLTTLRLVKFLYLADLYHARVSKRETLTGWPWAFVHFGPWCQQANEAINTAASSDLVIAKEYPSKFDDDKDYRLFWLEDTDEEPKIIDALPTYVWSRLQWAIQKWADDSYGLLDYVYFETEPMIDARPGALLDFTKSQMPETPRRLEIKQLPTARLEEAKKVVNRLKEKSKRAILARPPQGPIDALFVRSVSQLEGFDLGEGLEGTANLDNSETDRKP
jgi:hypothetical protein